MRSSGIALLLVTAVIAGCGGGSGGGKPNGEASKSAAQVVSDAKQAATSASSMHVAGHIVSGGTAITLDLSIGTKGSTGSMSVSGLGFDIIRVGDTAYIRGSDAFYKHFAGSAAAQLLHGKWLKAPATQGQFKSLGQFTTVGALFSKITSTHGTLVNKGETTYNGQKVVEIDDTTKGGKLYIAATGTPYPVALVGTKKAQSGTITFDRWNATVSPSAPKGAIDISQLGAG